MMLQGQFWAPALLCMLAALQGCRKAQPIVGTAQSARGQTEIIELGGVDGDTGWWPQVVFDAQDEAHVAFCDARHGKLRYGTRTHGAWAIETIAAEGNAGKYISLAVRPRGGVALSYYNQTTHYFEYTTRETKNSPWQTEHIAWGLEAGMASALRFSADGHAHVLYYISSGKLIHASRAPGAKAVWVKEELGDYQAVYSARIGAESHTNGLWFSYVNWQMDAARLYVAHLDDTGWHTQRVPTARSAGWRSQLSCVGRDVWVVHSENLTENTVLSFLQPEGTWRHVPLVHGGSSFAVASYEGRGVVAYVQRDKTQRGLYLTHEVDAGPWPVEALASSVGNDPDMALAIDSRGQVLLVYYDAGEHGLKSYTTHLAP